MIKTKQNTAELLPETDSVISNMTCKLYSRVFWIFLSNVIKINPHNFELYRFNVGVFWDTL